MKHAGLALAVVLASTGTVAGGDAEPRSVKIGEAFELRPGESARVDGAGLEIGLDKVVADSRCPKGEQCLWAGDATVRVYLRVVGGPRETSDVKLSAAEGAAIGKSGHSVRLLGLSPYPVSGRRIEPSDYRAKLLLSRATVPHTDVQ